MIVGLCEKRHLKEVISSSASFSCLLVALSLVVFVRLLYVLFSSTCFSNAQVGSLQSPEHVHLVVAERRTLHFGQAVVLTSSTIAAGMNGLRWI